MLTLKNLTIMALFSLKYFAMESTSDSLFIQSNDELSRIILDDMINGAVEKAEEKAERQFWREKMADHQRNIQASENKIKFFLMIKEKSMDFLLKEKKERIEEIKKLKNDCGQITDPMTKLSMGKLMEIFEKINGNTHEILPLTMDWIRKMLSHRKNIANQTLAIKVLAKLIKHNTSLSLNSCISIGEILNNAQKKIKNKIIDESKFFLLIFKLIEEIFKIIDINYESFFFPKPEFHCEAKMNIFYFMVEEKEEKWIEFLNYYFDEILEKYFKINGFKKFNDFYGIFMGHFDESKSIYNFIQGDLKILLKDLSESKSIIDKNLVIFYKESSKPQRARFRQSLTKLIKQIFDYIGRTKKEQFMRKFQEKLKFKSENNPLGLSSNVEDAISDGNQELIRMLNNKKRKKHRKKANPMGQNSDNDGSLTQIDETISYLDSEYDDLSTTITPEDGKSIDVNKTTEECKMMAIEHHQYKPNYKNPQDNPVINPINLTNQASMKSVISNPIDSFGSHKSVSSFGIDSLGPIKKNKQSIGIKSKTTDKSMEIINISTKGSHNKIQLKNGERFYSVRSHSKRQLSQSKSIGRNNLLNYNLNKEIKRSLSKDQKKDLLSCSPQRLISKITAINNLNQN